MKDRKQVLISVAIVAIVAVVIALSKPEPATARGKDVVHKQEAVPMPKPEESDEEGAPESSNPILALIAFLHSFL